MNDLKKSVQNYWNNDPCALRNRGTLAEGSRESFEAIARDRYTGDDFMLRVIPFHELRGKKTLEVGCGLGTDLVQFARAGAQAYALDFSSKSLKLARENLNVHGLNARLTLADAELIPCHDNCFDFVYSWGCLHHTADPQKAIQEIRRVLKPGGKFLIMLYHKYSLVSLQAYLLYGLFRLKPFADLDQILSNHIESPGTKAYTMKQVRELFRDYTEVEVKPIVTRYDLRCGRYRYMPGWVKKFVPSFLGWNLIITGKKP